MGELPLICRYGDGAVFAYRRGRPIPVEEFLRDVSQLVALLPRARHVLNLCTDRYRFSVGFAAALLRGQITLLPPNFTPDLIERLKDSYADVYCLTDGIAGPSGLETFDYPRPAEEQPAPQTVPMIPQARVAAIVFTSGSTGEPVPNRKSWGGLVRSARAEADRLGTAANPGTAVLGTVPPQHMYGLESTVLMAMQGGLIMDSGRPFFPADICAALEALPRPRILVTTPVHLRVLLEETDCLPTVDFLLCATSPLAPQLAAEAEAGFTAALHEIYGCTEAGQVATRRTVETLQWRTYPGIRLRQDDRGTWVRGGHVDTEVLLADVIELCGPEGFLLHGRTADLVNIAGKRTSLANLNYHLNSIQGVRDGTFVMPQEQHGNVPRLIAFAVAPGLSSEAIMAALRSRIDAAFLPRPLCLVDSLPRNDAGKLPRVELDNLVTRLAAKVG